MRLALILAAIPLELVLLYFLIRPRRKADAPSGAMYFIKEARKVLPLADCKRDYKKFHSLICRAEERFNRAKNEDVYDLGAAYDKLSEVKRLSWALLCACPQDASPYVPYLDEALAFCESKLNIFVGNSFGRRTTLKDLSHAAKEERARKLLSGIERENPRSDK